MIISTKHDLEFYLSDPATHDAALAHLQALLDEQYGYDDSGAWVLIGGGGLERLGLTRADAVALGAVDRTVAEPERSGPTLEQAKSVRIMAATTLCDAVLAPLGAEYGVYEMATWDQQYSEAVAYTADPAADVPLLAAMCVARGVSIATLAARVIANRSAWVALTGNVIGQRQRIVDQISAAETVEEVGAVDLTITLPT